VSFLLNSNDPDFSSLKGFQSLLSVVAQLRNPQSGCPWDLKQTHVSLKPYLLEEAYETLEAIDCLDAQEAESIAHFKEELGDVLLQVALHSQIAQDNQWFTIDDVAEALAEKLIRRHPHVFNNVTGISTPEAVTDNWQRLKQAEKQAGSIPSNHGLLSDISKAQPALSRAHKTSKKAVSVGFAWPNVDSLIDCVRSELDELVAEIPPTALAEANNKPELSPYQLARLQDELGDLLLATVSLGGHFGLDSEVALSHAVTKFTRRFAAMEALLPPLSNEADHVIDPKARFAHLSFAQWDSLWQVAKQIDTEVNSPLPLSVSTKDSLT
jgi:MazG family protein